MFKRLLQLGLLMATPVYAQVTFTYPALSTPNVWTNSNTFTAPVIFNSSGMASCGVLTTVAGVLTCGGYTPAPTFALTTTGTSGAASYSGNVINVPQYQAALGFTPAHSGANSDITSLSGLTTALSTRQGGTGATTAAAALANLGGLPLSGGTLTGPLNGTSASFSGALNGTSASFSGTVTAGTPIAVTSGGTGANTLVRSQANLGITGSTYNVIGYGAVGDGTTDDTAAIQAAFDACWNSWGTPNGGIVEFPGQHSYVVSATINVHVGCQIYGTISSAGYGGGTPPMILWNGPAAGATATITSVTTGAGSTPTLAAPAAYPWSYYATFTANNSLTPGQWVLISGLTGAAGQPLNNGVYQVSATGLSGTSFTVGLPISVPSSTAADSGVATVENVTLAYGNGSQYQLSISNISFASQRGIAANRFQGVGIIYPHVDTGTRMWNAQVQNATLYGVDFSAGGINIDLNEGTRFDSIGVAAVYWRSSGGSDSFAIENGTIDTTYTVGGATTEGAAIMVDESACGSWNNNINVRLLIMHEKIEINEPINPGIGAITLLDCPSNPLAASFMIQADNLWMAPYSTSVVGANFSGFAMIPANDLALSLHLANSTISGGSGSNTSPRWAGLPQLQRQDNSPNGEYVDFSYTPPLNLLETNQSAYLRGDRPFQVLGDANFGGVLWAHKVRASMLLETDPAFTALPNGTTLYPGDVIAPPLYWQANGLQYTLQTVTAIGTTGTPNGGATTCSASSYTLTCTSATDLSPGQAITINGSHVLINSVDATNPTSVLVYVRTNAGTFSSQALSFTAPTLSTSMQLLTKSNAAPTSGTWTQGSFVLNSNASSGGTAGWICTTAGTPGTWTALALTSGGSGLTGSIGGSALAAGACASGTVTLGQSATGHTGIAVPSDGTFLGGSYTETVSVSGTTATVNVCAVIAGTPAAKTYNVTVF